ncbi:hypothetical protein WA026_016982 [Henosepilachna vigintioctopunctata]|uniref:Uncharacterized protein n=1 Tax=Henosepilachna vigintioctopunctata TaxID=420089 RepID=A0AAW1U3T9_9CUCU
MLENNSKLLFLLLFLLGGIELCLSTEFVPVFMWETQNSVQPSPALQRINEKDFNEIVSEKLKTKPLVVVFAEETLSPEDFAQHNENGKTSFKALHKLLESSNVDYKPYVQNPIGAVKQLEKGVTEVSIASLLRNFNVPKDEVLIVDLNDAKDDEDRQDMLRRHDTAISQVFEKLLTNTDNILAIYTAHHPSWVTPEEVKHRNIRSLLQENEAVKTSTESDQKKTQQGETSLKISH